MSEVAKFACDGHELEFPVVEGSEKERAIDISQLRKQTGLITIDEGYVNTGSTRSAITFLNGEEGVLRYRGYAIEELAENCDFIEVAYLLIYGELPTQQQLDTFRSSIASHTKLQDGVPAFFDHFQKDAHPMSMLASVVSALATFNQDSLDPTDAAQIESSILSLMGNLPTVAAHGHSKITGAALNHADSELSYCENFLHMMFSKSGKEYKANPLFVKALNLLLIVHADHEQNCSTSTVRMVGSANANLYASIAAGVGALSGPSHGGANEAVVNMLYQIQADGGDVEKYVKKAKDKEDGFRLMGFGHRVYKNFDPRANIIKAACDELLEDLNLDDPLFDIAQRLAKVALEDEYFIKRNLYPNVDFYSGVIYRAMGIPVEMFTVLFAIGRLPGWISHWKEMHESPTKRICRPRQVYTGANSRQFASIDKRG